MTLFNPRLTVALRERLSATRSLRNSPRRLLLDHFGPSSVAVRDGERAVIADLQRRSILVKYDRSPCSSGSKGKLVLFEKGREPFMANRGQSRNAESAQF